MIVTVISPRQKDLTKFFDHRFWFASYRREILEQATGTSKFLMTSYENVFGMRILVQGVTYVNF